MTRALVMIAVLAGNAHAKPCPKNVAAQLVGEYPREVDAAEVRIAACVWGNFSGPGWMVFHFVPWASKNAETSPDGGIAFVKADGTLGASHTGNGLEQVDAQAVDLDGDGVDELVARARWDGFTSPEHGEALIVARVAGDKVETPWFQQVTYHLTMSDPIYCDGAMTLRPRGKAKQIVVTVKERHGKRDRDLGPPATCPLSAGRHVFTFANGTIVEAER